jgi:hypothetical protein
MVDSRSLARALELALARVASGQRPDGELPVEVRRAGEPGATADRTLFATALLLPALAQARSAAAAAILARGQGFLAGEAGGSGLVRFWPRGHPRHADIPPDLDDSAAVALALAPRSSRRLARLLLARRGADGRFPTWLVPRSPLELLRFPGLAGALAFRDPRHPFWSRTEARPDDADAGAQAQALLLLGARPETTGAAGWLAAVVAAGPEERADRWHRAWGVRWLAARAAALGIPALAPARAALLLRLEAEAPALARGGEAVDVALAQLAASALSAPVSIRAPLVERLLAEQDGGGGWPRASLWYGGPRRVVDWGSAEATTALAAGALAAELAAAQP